MMPGMGNMKNLMKQAQKMQKDLEVKTAELEQKEYVGESTNQFVIATVTGNRQVKDIEIKADVVDPDDVEMLQDLVIAAVNDGLSKAEEDRNQVLGKLSQGIPGL